MNKYEERVQKRAEEMAALTHGEKDMSAYDTKDDWISLYAPLARLSVQREAEIIIEWMDNYAWTLEGKQEYLISKGLIPPKTETTCNGECTSGIPSHTCPFKADIYNDNSLCACCDKCTSACSDNR